ncbi:MAG TPA: MFS transporter [Candidatus Izemoplasmatales bacterium]|nr:MFS transporter [Candidatus Izemoplasmatales bacterium]
MSRLRDRKVYLYVLAISCLAIGSGLSFSIFTNYFKEVFEVGADARGILELPREAPGMLMVLIFAIVAFLNDIRIVIFALFLMLASILFLGVFTPTYNLMIFLLFIGSLGQHLTFAATAPLDLSLSRKENVGRDVGFFRGVFTGSTMIGALIVIVGFRTELFSFETNIILPFLVAAVLFAVAIILFSALGRVHTYQAKRRAAGLVFRKEYKLYYLLVILHGVQKQILIVFGPWVLVELLNSGADAIAFIALISGFIGIFFIQFMGHLIDKLGVKKALYIDALSFVFVYLTYGFLVYGIVSGALPKSALVIALAYTIVIIDRMSGQMGVVRTVYLKQILVEKKDLQSTISLGMSLDHVVSIASAIAAGLIWVNIGPHFVFFIAAGFSLLNILVAYLVKDKQLPVNPVSQKPMSV